MVNLGKTKGMVFNGLKNVLIEYHFYFQGVEIKITTAYTYIGVQFSGPTFGLRKTPASNQQGLWLLCPPRLSALLK
jgi:hypothetical protein